MITQQDVTIIIPHLGRTEEQRNSLKECLLSLYESDFPMENVIVSWNSCGDFSGFYPYRDIVNVKTMALEKQGQCAAVNAAAATVTTPWIMVTNDDMIFAPGWFGKLVGGVMPISCLSPQLIEPQDGAPTFEKFFAGGAGGDFNKEAWLQYASNHMAQSLGGLRSGFNLPFLIKKEVWDLVGGYDVNFDPWGSNSDSDLEYKLKLAGVQPYQNTNCPVYHFSQTSGTFEPKNRPSWEKNWQYFIDKWGFPRTDDGIWEATFEIPSKEEGRIFTPWWEGFYEK